MAGAAQRAAARFQCLAGWLAHTTIMRWMKLFTLETITLDGCAASHRAVREMKADGLLPRGTKVRSSKCQSNLAEQGH
jgi:hypothetical protein